jgi:hypothetical protein
MRARMNKYGAPDDTDIAEGFKQGAQAQEVSMLVEVWSAPWLKS